MPWHSRSEPGPGGRALVMVPRLPCRRCGKQPWNTSVIAMGYPDGDPRYDAHVTEWWCGITGRTEERAVGLGFPVLTAEAACLDCGHIWWSRHDAAVEAAEALAHGPTRAEPPITLKDFYRVWENEDDWEEM